MKKQILMLLMILLPIVASAHDIEVKNADGVTIYYNYINDYTELEVTFRDNNYYHDSNRYTGKVVIPEAVIYMNRTRKVTGIDDNAFYNCPNLTSVTIPNSITRIGEYAFEQCSGLTFITIPSSVNSLGQYAFNLCSGLTSVIISNSVTSINRMTFAGCSKITSVTIPNSVTSIGEGAFQNCKSLASVTISNSVTSIDEYAFGYCTSLTSITIPNSVTRIDKGAFFKCSGLTSVTIGNSVTSIGSQAFYACSGLASITIPNSVKSIGERAFYSCSSLTSVTIGKNVTSIDSQAFDGCDIPTVISLIENPFAIYGKSSEYKTFTINTFNNATLYVYKGAFEKYKTTEGWKDFVFIEESITAPTSEKCEKPTISYMNGKLTFASSTEGATCNYSITDSDIKTGKGNEVQLGVTYNISVYATKEGYENSEVATATLCWIDATPQTEGIVNGVAQMAARPVLIKAGNGTITVEGVDDRTDVSIYTTDGKQVGSAISHNNLATIFTSMQPGSIAIVKIGNRSVKVAIK